MSAEECLHEVVSYGRDQIDYLKEQLRQNKKFMSMVIHDMRNPTVAIKQGLQDTVWKMKQVRMVLDQHAEFAQEAKLLHL